ncbi:polysaccharide pyruvyl transferase CsaB [Paenibacillus sp. J31TS4]|uniref:polysaccharide pyruvyl transferase CsaB n=1 Tax=Paenibacillus sp. J31TS4 TaxID=2807195 RepID=UPI001B050A89|nr:polysaccharide pyruvyl transferase CsaB [Paenibacillus sp. J31TS4]GIP40968.1 polysaccharide pyruvyl transferase CsaB [Paenibacillus sp. J31TS4]
MGTPLKRIVLSGYYGFKNSGDEAVLQSILLALESEGKRQGVTIEPIVLSIDPAWTERMYGVRAAHRMKPGAVWQAIRSSDGLISGGGSLLQDATGSKTIPYYLAILKLAQWLRKPTYIYSQGIGPVNRRQFDSWIAGVFRECRYVSVRDAESAQLLKKMGLQGVPVEVVPDPVMGLPLRSESEDSKKSRPVVGVSVRYWKEDRSDLQRVAAWLQELERSRDVEIRFLPFHLPSDRTASEETIRFMGAEGKENVGIAEDVHHPQDMLAEVSRCDLMIGMRLHSLIYAASQYVPVMGISYDPKIDQFLQRLGLKPAGTTETLDSSAAARESIRLLQNREQWVEEKRSFIDSLKQEAHQPAKQIVASLL